MIHDKGDQDPRPTYATRRYVSNNPRQTDDGRTEAYDGTADGTGGQRTDDDDGMKDGTDGQMVPTATGRTRRDGRTDTT